MKLLSLSGASVQNGLLSRIVLAGFTVGSLVLFMAMSGLAAEWSLLPSMSTKAYFNDNLFLTPFPHDPTYGYLISPGVEFAGKTERLEVSGKAALDFADYYGGEPNRFTNIFLPLTMKYRTEKEEWAFTGGFTRDNTLMGELLTTGVVLRFTQRNLWSLNPSWTRMISEKLAFQSSFQFNDATYQDGLKLGLVDYQVFGGAAGLIYHVNEHSDMQLMGTYMNFHTTNAPFGIRASYPGIVLNVTHAVTESLKAAIYGGPRFVGSTTEFGGNKNRINDTTWIYGASLTQQFENASLQLSVTSDILPSGFGLLVQTDRLSLLASYSLTETFTASFDLSGYLVSGASPLSNGGSLPENRLFSFTPALQWKFSEWWKMEASYAFRIRDAEFLPEHALSNAFTVMITYYPPKLAISN